MAKTSASKKPVGRPLNSKTRPKGDLILSIIPVPKKVNPRKGKPSPTSKLTPEMEKRKWKPGFAPNPTGKNGKQSTGEGLISKAYKINLTESCDLPGMEQLTWAEAIAYGMARAAARGETTAAKELRETTEGATPKNIRIGDPEGNALAPPIFNVGFVKP